jgi:hypothetical protein
VTSRHEYGVRERIDDQGNATGTWEFGCDVDGQWYSVGYCVPWEEVTAQEITEKYGSYYVPAMLQAQEKKRQFKDKYHPGGHRTREEACACYREFLLDQALSRRSIVGTLCNDETCDVPSCLERPSVEVEFYPLNVFLYLCQDHDTRGSISSLFPLDRVCSNVFTLFF